MRSQLNQQCGHINAYQINTAYRPQDQLLQQTNSYFLDKILPVESVCRAGFPVQTDALLTCKTSDYRMTWENGSNTGSHIKSLHTHIQFSAFLWFILQFVVDSSILQGSRSSLVNYTTRQQRKFGFYSKGHLFPYRALIS